VLAHRAVNARVFGSVVNGSDTDESDLDILVDTTPDTTLFDLGAIRFKLLTLLCVCVGRGCHLTPYPTASAKLSFRRLGRYESGSPAYGRLFEAHP